MEPWYDTHVHLDRYQPEERAALLERAEAAGVRLIHVAADLDSSAEVLILAGSSPVIAGGVVGIHPKSATEWFEHQLTFFAGEPGVVGIGECGFDGAGGDWETQVATFRKQAGIARALGRALVLHVDGDNAWPHLVSNVEVLDDLRVIRHYFTGDAAQAAWHREHGHYLSFGKPLLRESRLRRIALDYPAELLLIETDSYPLPGRTTEPADAVQVGKALGALRGWSLEDTREQLAANATAAFRLEPRTPISPSPDSGAA